MVAPAVEGINLFKVAGRSISGWVPSFKMAATSPVKQPFCSQLEERLLLWLDYHPQVASYARGDIGPQFAATYRLPIPEHVPFAIGYTFENKPYEDMPDVVGMLTNGKPFIAEAGMEDDKRSDRNLAKAETARRLVHIQEGTFWIGTEHTLTCASHYILHAKRKVFPAYVEMVMAVQESWPWGEVASVEEIEDRLAWRWPAHLIEAATWKLVGDGLAAGHLLVDLKQHTLDRKLLLALLLPDASPRIPDPLPEILETVPDAASRLPAISLAQSWQVPGSTFDAFTLDNEEEQALGDQLYTALGLLLRGYWPARKPKLMGHLHQYGTEFLVVDDAHDLSLKHLMFIKELTDQGRLQYDHPLGLYLVAAGRGNTIPLKETLDMPETTWVQFRRCFDKLQPFCRIAGHTSEEVRAILASVVRFKPHDKRKTTTSNTAEWWAMRETIWKVVGGENK